jgi:hypothetical protein
MLLAVSVLLSGLSGVALANDPGMVAHDPSEYSPSADSSLSPANADASQIREPIETGAVPDQPESSSGLYSNPGGDASTLSAGWSLFRPDIEGSP